MSYAGDLTVKQCWELLEKDRNAFLIDVRTRAEWAFVGLPMLGPDMQELILLEWQEFPEMNLNDRFASVLAARLDEAGAGKDAKLCFLCRSGARSLSAAQTMTAAGYASSYNISGGFEGDLDANGHRGASNGWKADGLPWRQS